jgi:hypothetical protein
MSDYEPAYQKPIVEVLSIPKTVKEIEMDSSYVVQYQLQWMLPYLKKFKVSSENETYASYKGIMYSKDKKTLMSVPCKYEKETVSVPSGVKTIKEYAFFYCTDIATVKLPSTVTATS